MQNRPARRMDEALEHYKESCGLGPRDAQGHGEIANVRFVRRQVRSAMEEYEFTKKLKTKDCPKIDYILTQFTPLPPRNLTEVIVSILELVQADDVKAGKKTDIPICPDAKPPQVRAPNYRQPLWFT